MITRISTRLNKFFRLFHRNEWTVKLLSLEQSANNDTKPGLLLIQIDGLSRKQLESAISCGKMPFLRNLLKNEEYKLNTLYSGLPSSTAAVQGELFYGIKTIVPSHSFRNHMTGKVQTMFDTSTAIPIDKFLNNTSPGILKNGSSYCNIYSGGAEEANFCSSKSGWGIFPEKSGQFKKIRLGFLYIVHIWEAVRIIALLGIELILAIIDSIRGIIAKKDLLLEIQFVPTRVAICVLLRELITFGVKVDIARGLPVIHANFLGYDEQAHRRGPSSAFAHWTLKGIDRAIKGIWHSAHQAPLRHYDVWIYSDHGQQETISYSKLTGKSIAQSVKDIIEQIDTVVSHDSTSKDGSQLERVKWLNILKILKLPEQIQNSRTSDDDVVVTAKGPIGHIYLKHPLTPAEHKRCIDDFISIGKIPLVLTVDSSEKVIAWNEKGSFKLPEDANQVLGEKHPFLEEAANDLINLVKHPDAGDFVISGWKTDGKPLSFPTENGAHGGPGFEEVRAFALLPSDACVLSGNNNFLRPQDIYNGVNKFLNPVKRKAASSINSCKSNDTGIFRIMTYNVHSCIGMDGQLSVDRIARVIARYNPDVVALQELDVGRKRTFKLDQAQAIADELEMNHHFHPSLIVDEEKYGNAIFSRYPVHLVKSGQLPKHPGKDKLELRGALWVEVSTPDQKLQIINTHLGLDKQERHLQINDLLGVDWLNHEDCSSPKILCGDFNMLPQSSIYQTIKDKYNDAHVVSKNNCPECSGRTWFGKLPVGRIDYVFVSSQFNVINTRIPRNSLTRKASDHLPLIADLKIKV